MRNCPLCKASESSTYMKPSAWNNRHGIELRKCKQCRFVFSAVSIYEYISAGNQYLDKTKTDFVIQANKQRLPLLADEIVKKTRLNKGKVLDFGCGIGLLALCLQEKGFSTYGIEPSKICLERHKELNITSTDDMHHFEEEKNKFDLVIMKDVLEHVDHPVELLQKVTSFVKPGGYFYIRVPNVYHYPLHWSIDTKSHVNHFSPKKLSMLLEKNKMKKVDFIGVYDISTKVGKLYNSVFWKARYFLPMYHQISLLCQKGF
jgi:2-polyprenyl-3-methyl-5-hydroxy-6-metoxy-1,4-benzoquinol methylase